VDIEQTGKLRREERQARLARGVPYEQFLQVWNKQSPPKEALQYYGTWPDAKPTGPVFRP